MSIRIVRAIGRPPADPDTDPVQPRLHIAALPHPATCALSIALSRFVSTLGVLRPIESEPAPYQPLAQIGVADSACCHRAAIAVEADRIAVHWPPCDEGIEVVGRLRPASVLLAVIASTELRGLRRVDAPQANTVAVDFQCIAVDDAGLPGQVVGKGWEAGGQKREPGNHTRKSIALAR